MLRYIKHAAIALSFVLILAVGCSDRGTNIPVAPDVGFIRTSQDFSVSPAIHVFYPEFTFQIRNQFRLMEMATYVPRVSYPAPYGPFEETPLLVLLPPQDGDQFFFFRYGLQEIANELIAAGTIRPMTICCVSNNKIFGGYFYAGRGETPSGDYDAVIGGSLLEFMRSRYAVFESPSKTAIGGVEMGAYGAFRAAIINPGTFSAVSATDGPLDFDGRDGQSGLIDLFDDALAEQGLDASNFKGYDSAGAWNISRMFIGGSYAFSPHDTLIIWHDSIFGAFPFQTKISVIDNLFQIDDTVTLITDVVNQVGADFDFHLPFDGNGNVYPLIWNMWLNNNLERMLSATGLTALGGTEVFISTTPEARFGFYDQTQSWINTISNAPYSYNVTVNEYKGYDGNPATTYQYMGNVLREMLIFHSNNFGK